jgi:asparaginyl-tRNA synthetase
MMENTSGTIKGNILIKRLYESSEQYSDKTIEVSGWIRSVRASNNFGFVIMNDGSAFNNLQVVIGSDLPNFAEISALNVGAAIMIEGKLVLTPEAKQPFEVQASKVVVEGESSPDYPLQKKRHS